MEYPYPGFSWSISQHIAPAANGKTIFELLKAAYVFSESKSYRTDITNYMIEKGLLPPNIRSDQSKPEIWRDYQQVLAELGLIVSTKFTNNKVIITPIGLLWLDGLVGYSELITNQVLKYQYPNGFKQDISKNVIEELTSKSFMAPSNRIILDSMNGVLIKPAVLILRILVELNKNGLQNVSLSSIEIATHLMKATKNSDWQRILSELISYRSKRHKYSFKDKKRIRHAQEWMRLLSFSDIFEIVDYNELRIRLKSTWLHIYELEKICLNHEELSNFWIPNTDNKDELAFNWFDYFSSVKLENQWSVDYNLVDDEFLEKNYPDGIFDDKPEEAVEIDIEKSFNINLSEYDLSKSEVKFLDFVEVDVSKIADGRKAIIEKTKFHNSIVKDLASNLIKNGFNVYEDKKSVDLLASKDSYEFIFEIKTINKNNIFKYFRLGIGQLSEYRFRRQQEIKMRPYGVLVLSSTYDFPDWVIEFMNSDINLGLVSFESSSKFKAYTNGDIEKIICV